MKTLLIMRHAKSSWAEPGSADHDRPLNPRGKRDAPRMGQLLSSQGLLPDLILSSTAKRARQTARRVAQGSGHDVPIELVRSLYHSAPQTQLQLLCQQPDQLDCVMLVAHNPGLEETLDLLVGEYHRLPTAALAQLDVPIGKWIELTAETDAVLKDLWLPRDL